MATRDILAAYRAEAADLIAGFERATSDELFAPIAHLLPQAPSRIADIGAGTGRDAAYFVARGHFVLAVEPTELFREAGARLHPSPRIAWLDDALPELERVMVRGEAFDCVLVNGVWHHIDDAERAIAMPKLARLVAPGGVLVMRLRHGPGSPTRAAFPASATDTVALAASAGLRVTFQCDTDSILPANRALGVTRTWLAFAR